MRMTFNHVSLMEYVSLPMEKLCPGTGFKREDGIYELNTKLLVNSEKKLKMVQKDTLKGVDRCNRRIGHTSKDVIEDMSKKQMVKGMNMETQADKVGYKQCAEKKQSKSSHEGNVIPEEA